MMGAWLALTLSSVVLVVVSFFFLNGTYAHRPHHRRFALAVLATSAGLYVLPLGNQAYDLTSSLWHLDSQANGLLWLIVGAVLLTLGAVAYRGGAA
jgi:drug/metabolite transporter (DMT)-like permease